MSNAGWSLCNKQLDHKSWWRDTAQFHWGLDAWHFNFHCLKVLHLSFFALPHSSKKLWTHFILLFFPCLFSLQRYFMMILLFKIKTAWTLAESNEISIFCTMATTSLFWDSISWDSQNSNCPAWTIGLLLSSERLAVAEQQCIEIILGNPMGDISLSLSPMLHTAGTW